MNNNPKLLVIVPYRDRAAHLPEFLPYIKTTLHAQEIPHEIAVVEQSAGKLFNRGLLCNVGFVALGHSADYVCLHDVDMIGEDFDYSYTEHAAHISARERRRNYEEWYPEYLGGVTLFSAAAFTAVNGFSNEYYGWGCEDDDLCARCRSFDIPIIRRQGRYATLDHQTMPHEERPQRSPNYNNNLQRLETFRRLPSPARKKIARRDGLTTIAKHMKTSNVEVNEIYTRVFVEV